MIVSAIAAMDRAGLIGDGVAIPWHLPRDLRRFRSLTIGKPILMGRRTFESLGRPLPGRLNLVLTRQVALQAEGCRVAGSIEEALSIAKDSGAVEAMVIGGGAVYAETVDLWDRLLLTVVDGSFRGDVHFPVEATSALSWRAVDREECEADDRNPHPHRFVALERLRGEPAGGGFDLRSWLEGGHSPDGLVNPPASARRT
ncbi:dihydrofolate reductase [Isosphaeraceae bacterium EP7]